LFGIDFIFSLSITDDYPKNIKEVVDFEDGKLWKKDIVKEIESLDKNEAKDLVGFLAGRKPICRK
jgi:hypothetical protein